MRLSRSAIPASNDPDIALDSTTEAIDEIHFRFAGIHNALGHRHPGEPISTDRAAFADDLLVELDGISNDIAAVLSSVGTGVGIGDFQDATANDRSAVEVLAADADPAGLSAEAGLAKIPLGYEADVDALRFYVDAFMNALLAKLKAAANSPA
jgi:hypothetical protein